MLREQTGEKPDGEDGREEDKTPDRQRVEARPG